MITLNQLHHGDCMELLPLMPANSVDMILCDLPYGVTRNEWDKPLPLAQLWQEYKRIAKSNAAIVLFASGRFSSQLVASSGTLYRYSLIWHKSSPSGFLNARRQPLRSHEDILVFYRKQPVYNPQKTFGHPRKISTAHHKRNSRATTNYGTHQLSTYDSTERFPTSVLTFAADTQRSSIHPTQKPVALCEWLINTYTNPGMTVLDNCAGSGTTAIAARNCGRNYICMEKNEDMWRHMVERLAL